jgi:ectoine hydroxylase-related dioxygenase (phytanoyl-CoA dioxygenase family)
VEAQTQRPEDVAALVAERGWAILPGAIAPELARALVARIDALLEELRVPFGSNAFLGLRTRRIFNLLARDPGFERVPLHEAVLPVVEALLGRELLLSSLTAIEMSPGQEAQPFHADDGSYGLPKPHPPFNATALWALSDFTLENGATRLVPDSHRRERNPRRGEQPEFESALMPAGSVLVYHGSLWHAGGANRSSARRLAIVCNYCAGFLRQEECQLLALPRERVARFEPRLRELVGYGTYRGLLGHVDQRNPAELVDPGVRTEMVWHKLG